MVYTLQNAEPQYQRLTICYNLRESLKIYIHLRHSFNIDIIGLCETFLTSSVHDNEFLRALRSHRQKGRGRYDLESDTLESVWVQIALPRRSKDSEEYALGDFNINFFPDK
ncbi:hypothetical protein MAR_010169 [Mya arenaria]|uniref:Uncharacterized protein n=1 Tax=Mya arenaria TaxID=6604 RepID=A0ABY7E8X9_MYAAR|nr:hypothetical protein MAR_010169 [Mya arenaria]